MSKGTHEALKLPDSCYYHFLESGKMVRINDYAVLPFDVHHNHPFMPCKEPLGLLITDIRTAEKLVYITDTSHVDYNFTGHGITHWMIECNHSGELIDKSLENGVIPKSLYDRIRYTHFSLAQVIGFFLANDLSKAKEIHLIHISKNNGDPELFQQTIQALTGVPVYT